jgi:PST family polysaccharide transporter
VLISVAIPHIVDGPKIPQVLLMMIPVFFLSGMTTLLESVVMKRGAVKKVGYTTVIADTVSLILALMSLKLGAGVFSLVVQRVVREFVIMATYGVANPWTPRFVLDRLEAVYAIKFARNIVGARIIGLGGTAVIDVTIGALLGAREAGIYRLVVRLLTIGADILFQPFRAALWVRLPQMHDDTPALRRAYMDLVEVFGVGMFAAMTGMTLIAAPMFGLFFKPEWQDAVPLVALLAISRLIYVPGMAGEVIFALSNHMRFLMQFSVASAVLMVGAAFVSAHFGLTTFIIAGIGVALILQSWQLPQMARCIDLQIGE